MLRGFLGTKWPTNVKASPTKPFTFFLSLSNATSERILPCSTEQGIRMASFYIGFRVACLRSFSEDKALVAGEMERPMLNRPPRPRTN